MDSQELLVRTMNAAKEAREKGFLNTANALDEIVENLLHFLKSQIQSIEDERASSLHEMPDVH